MSNLMLNFQILEKLRQMVSVNPELNFVKLLERADVLIPVYEGRYRMVTHYQYTGNIRSVATLNAIENSVFYKREPGSESDGSENTGGCGAV